MQHVNCGWSTVESMKTYIEIAIMISALVTVSMYYHPAPVLRHNIIRYVNWFMIAIPCLGTFDK